MKFFSLFSGVGGFEVGLFNSGFDFECVGFSEIDDVAMGIYKNHFPSHQNFGDATKIQTKDIPNFDLLVGGFPCFVEGSQVTTDVGFKNIENVNVGDKVLTHNNCYKPVNNVMVKSYEGIGRQIRVSHRGSVNDVICTPNHPFRVMDKDGRYVWKRADKLSTDDYVYIGINVEERDVVFDYEVGINQSTTEVRHDVLDDLDWWWCVGYYLGDGWYQKRRKRNGKWCASTRITLGVNPKECDYIASRFSKFFVCNVQSDKRKISFNNVLFYNFVKSLGDSAIEKHLPRDFDYYPKDVLASLIKGYVYADGYEEEDYISVSSISKELMLQVWYALVKIYNEVPSFFFSETADTCVIEGRTVHQHDIYSVEMHLNKKRIIRHCVNDDGVWLKVVKNDNYMIDGLVYNLEVEDDHSYVVNGCTVKNCQAFSCAGHRGGFDDTRGTLFFEVARILADKRPRYFLLENVRGLLSNEHGETFQKILRILSDLGYNVTWSLLNSKDFGVPQNRRRLYLIGHLRGESWGKIFSQPKQDGEVMQTRLSDDILKVRSATKSGYEVAHIGDSVQLARPGSKTARGRVGTQIAHTLTLTGSMGVMVDKDHIRMLTPLECERVQGFPDNWTKYLDDGSIVPDTKRYRCCGNAVTTNVVSYIVNKMLS